MLLLHNFLLLFLIASPNEVWFVAGVEEFFIRGPGDLQDKALKKFMQERKDNPETKDMGDDAPVYKAARDYSVKRFMAQPEDSLSLHRVTTNDL